jgi:hypothetical protein
MHVTQLAPVRSATPTTSHRTGRTARPATGYPAPLARETLDTPTRQLRQRGGGRDAGAGGSRHRTGRGQDVAEAVDRRL